MKNKLIKTLMVLMFVSTLTGCKETRNIDVSVKAKAETTTQFDKLTFERTEVYHTSTKEELEQFNKIVENRKGKIIVQILDGIVLNDQGDGDDGCGYYIHYDSTKFSAGDRVQTVFVYDPTNNYLDGILYRTDTLL